jgi:inhibitor of KinA sporulation pathway (predicted exonuclease)
MTDSNVAICMDSNDYNYYGIPYALNGDETTLDFENCKRYVADWRPYVGASDNSSDDSSMNPMMNPMMDDFCKHISEYAQSKIDLAKDSFTVKETEDYKTLENELNNKNEAFSKLEKDLEKVKAECTTLNSNYSLLETNKTSLEEEVKGLKQYKIDKEFELKESTYNEMLEEYSELKDVEEYKNLIKDKFNYSLEELEVKLKVFAFDNNITINKKQKFSKQVEKPVDLAIEKKINSENLGAWACAVEYLPKQ